MKDVVTVYTEPADTATRQAFARNLDGMATMVEGWDLPSGRRSRKAARHSRAVSTW